VDCGLGSVVWGLRFGVCGELREKRTAVLGREVFQTDETGPWGLVTNARWPDMVPRWT